MARTVFSHERFGVRNSLILDATVGARGIYHGQNNFDIDSWCGVDLRKGNFSFKHEDVGGQDKNRNQKVIIEPTILADFKYLPFRDEIFNLVIFDPPYSEIHWAWYEKQYGKAWNKNELITNIFHANKEFARVLISQGILLIKTMPKTMRQFETLFSNFRFLLPIFTWRAPYNQPLENRKGAVWLLGFKNNYRELGFSQPSLGS